MYVEYIACPFLWVYTISQSFVLGIIIFIRA